MNDKQIDELIDKALNDEQALPAGFADRLEQCIDNLSAAEHPHKRIQLFAKRNIYRASGIAAAIIIGITLFFQTGQKSHSPADTFTDPQEAAIVAQQVLAMMSTQLNKGLDQVAEARQEIEKTTKIINQQIK